MLRPNFAKSKCLSVFVRTYAVEPLKAVPRRGAIKVNGAESESSPSDTAASPAVSSINKAAFGDAKSFSEVFPVTLTNKPSEVTMNNEAIDWTTSYHGVGTLQLTPKQVEILHSDLDPEDVEIKPDGLLYLPEIKYRRVLNKAIGPGLWGLIPRSDTAITEKLLTREYGLIVMGKLVAIARGEQDYFSKQGIPTATEGCKSNALMRCCKDLGIGSELWDPRFIRKFKKKYCEQKMVTQVSTGKKKMIWKRKDDPVEYPYKL